MVNFFRDVNSVALEFLHQLVKEDHVRSLVVNKRDRAVFSIVLEEKRQVQTLMLTLVDSAERRYVQMQLYVLGLGHERFDPIEPILQSLDVLLVEEVVDCLSIVVVHKILNLNNWQLDE